MRIEILVFDGFDEMDAIGPFEVLRQAAALDVAMVSAAGAAAVTGAHGLAIHATDRLGRPDGLVVPGGGWNNRAAAGTYAEVARGELPALIADRATTCSWVASVCSGAMLLAAAGLTAGRPVTAHHDAHDDLEATGALVDRAARVVDDGNLITAAGVTSGLDLALRLLEREAGLEIARAAAAEIEYGQQYLTAETAAGQAMPPRIFVK